MTEAARPEGERVAALEARVADLGAEVRDLRSARHDLAGRVHGLGISLETQGREGMATRQAVDALSVRMDGLSSLVGGVDARLRKLEARLMGAGLVGLVVVEVLLEIGKRLTS